VIRFFTFVIAVLLSVGLWAQAPQSFSYQAVIRGTNNSLVVNKPVGIKVSLLQGSENGTAIYVETHKPTSNENGLVSIAIGGGNKDASSNAFTSIDWSKGPYFIKTETDPTGGTSYSLNNVSQLLSVPYAIHSKTAESLVGGNSGSNSGSFSHFIGEEFGGGVIFHLWKDTKGVEHGLVLAKTDLSTSYEWSDISDIEIGQTAQSNRDGLSNSNAIAKQNGHTKSAAKLCLDLVSGGVSDWYLPSKQEMYLLWNNYYSVSNSLNQITGSTQLSYKDFKTYWTSSEYDKSMAWSFDFEKGKSVFFDDGNNSKNSKNYVRAIRAF
jgi:hypothetical protein